jgi:hypothetical protein
LPFSLTCDECLSTAISTFPVGFLGRKWPGLSVSHVINTSDVTCADFFDTITADAGGQPSADSCFLQHL